MAIPCIVIYKNKEYRFDEFQNELHNGLLNDLIDKEDIVGIAKIETVTNSKEEATKLAKRLRDKKIKGFYSAVDFGISQSIYNGALELAASQVEKGTKLGNAIANAIKWVDEQMKGSKWNKGLFGKHLNDVYVMKMPNGKEIDVKVDETKETTELINGFYSPIEKSINEIKTDKLTSKQWSEKLKGEEAKWTGLTDWLATQQGSLSKADIKQFLKDNRIEVVEVVKEKNPDIKESDLRVRFDGSGFTIDVNKKGISGVYVGLDELDVEYDGENYEEVESAAIQEGLSQIREGEQGDDTKFSQYQLEGEKENYKEVLVTMPSKKSKKRVRLDELIAKGGIANRTESEQKEFRQLIRDEEIQTSTDKFKSSHFDEPNILVHLRMNTRTDADGNKVLFLEELQSDWGQKGKKEGFKIDSKQELPKLNKENTTVRVSNSGKYYHLYKGEEFWVDISKNDGDKLSKEDLHSQLLDKANRLAPIAESANNSSKILSAPFVTDTNEWTKLGLKVALKEAVKQGEQMQRIAFEKLVDKKMDWVEARMKKLGKLEVKCP